MKLLLYDVDYNTEIIFEDGYVLSIECENAEYFSKLILSFKNSLVGHISIEEQNSLLDLEKEAITLIDYFSIENYEKSLTSKFYKLLEKTYNNDEDIIDKIKKISKIFDDIGSYVTSGFNVDFEINTPINISDYLKFFDLRIKNQSNDNFEKLINFIELVSILKVYKVILLVNAKSFFNKYQLEEIIKRCSYTNQRVLMIDNVCSKNHYPNEIKLLIDNDFYDILIK